MFWDTGPERKGPGSMPRSGVAPLSEGLVPGLDGRRLDLVQVVLLVLERRSLILVFLALLANTSRSYLHQRCWQVGGASGTIVMW